jgi:hypothetical protein
MAWKSLEFSAVGLLLAPSLASASTFSTECTLPAESTTLVTSANIRGTFDILWSGLFTIFICIWTVQHLNVPEQRNGRDQGWRGDLKWAWKGFFTKLKWMIFTMILPEFLVAKAFAEMTTARKSMQLVKSPAFWQGRKLSEAEVSNWTRTHAFYAEMGGFVIRPHADRSDFRTVATSEIFMLRKMGSLATLPTITAEHLNDLSNGDSFTKGAAIAQVSWMVVQVIVRASRRLPITQLEITACGFAASTFLTYLLWWKKPQAIRSTTELPLSADTDIDADLLEITLSTYHRAFALRELLLVKRSDRALMPNESMPNDSVVRDADIRFVAGILLGGLMLGSVQCAAWNFNFPTAVELFLWRYLSIVTITAYPAMYIVGIILKTALDYFELAPNINWVFPFYATIALYSVARLFILFETIYTLFHLPPGAFVSSWSSSIPHLA